MAFSLAAARADDYMLIFPDNVHDVIAKSLQKCPANHCHVTHPFSLILTSSYFDKPLFIVVGGLLAAENLCFKNRDVKKTVYLPSAHHNIKTCQHNFLQIKTNKKEYPIAVLNFAMSGFSSKSDLMFINALLNGGEVLRYQTHN